MQLPSSVGFSDAEIIEAVFFPVVNEGCRVLDEGIVAKAGDLDVAAVMGMGFPPFRGGLMHWADTVGAKKIHARLTELSKVRSPTTARRCCCRLAVTCSSR